MNAEYIMASSKDMMPAAFKSRINMKNSICMEICGIDGKNVSNMINNGNICESGPAPGIMAEGVHMKYQKEAENKEILSFSDKALSPDSYCSLDIAPEDELKYIMNCCMCLKSDGPDISSLMPLLETAEAECRLGKNNEFYETLDALYDIYESLCQGTGGRLFVSGDYLSFSEEAGQINVFSFFL